MKNSNDTIGKRARELPACSAVPQATALPRAPRIEPAKFRLAAQCLNQLRYRVPRVSNPRTSGLQRSALTNCATACPAYRTRELPACSAVPQPTALPRALCTCNYTIINKNISIKFSQEPVDILLATVSILLFLHTFYVFDIFLTLYLKDWCIHIAYSFVRTSPLRRPFVAETCRRVKVYV